MSGLIRTVTGKCGAIQIAKRGSWRLPDRPGAATIGVVSAAELVASREDRDDRGQHRSRACGANRQVFQAHGYHPNLTPAPTRVTRTPVARTTAVPVAIRRNSCCMMFPSWSEPRVSAVIASSEEI